MVMFPPGFLEMLPWTNNSDLVGTLQKKKKDMGSLTKLLKKVLKLIQNKPYFLSLIRPPAILRATGLTKMKGLLLRRTEVMPAVRFSSSVCPETRSGSKWCPILCRWFLTFLRRRGRIVGGQCHVPGGQGDV